MTASEVARELRIDRRTLSRHRTQGTGPEFVRIGHAVRYEREALDRWLSARRFRSIADERIERNSAAHTGPSATNGVWRPTRASVEMSMDAGDHYPGGCVSERWTASNRCSICDGSQSDPLSKGSCCFGYRGSGGFSGAAKHCERRASHDLDLANPQEDDR
jgi:hypothetical protein